MSVEEERGPSPVGGSLLFRGLATAVLVVAAILRWFAGPLHPDAVARDPSRDPDAYLAIANTLRRHGVFGEQAHRATAYRPPLYPLMLVPLVRDSNGTPTVSVSLFLLLHLAATALILFSADRLAVGLRLGLPARLAAAFFIAVDPLLVGQAALLMTETVYAALLTTALALWWRAGLTGEQDQSAIGNGAPPGRAVTAGVVVGLAALTRPTTWAAWLLLGLLALMRGRGPVGRWMAATLAAGAVAAPWAIRNQVQFGSAIVTTTHGGYTLWLGMNPVFFREVVQGPHEVWVSGFDSWTADNARQTAGMDERERDAWYRRQAINWMTRHPFEAILTAGHHVRSFWGLTPRTGPVGIRRAVAAASLFLFLCALGGLALPADPVVRKRLADLAAVAVAFTVVHAVYWSDLRMRTPIEPFLALLAARFLDRWISQGTRLLANHRPTDTVR